MTHVQTQNEQTHQSPRNTHAYPTLPGMHTTHPCSQHKSPTIHNTTIIQLHRWAKKHYPSTLPSSKPQSWLQHCLLIQSTLTKLLPPESQTVLASTSPTAEPDLLGNATPPLPSPSPSPPAGGPSFMTTEEGGGCVPVTRPLWLARSYTNLTGSLRRLAKNILPISPHAHPPSTSSPPFQCPC